MSTRITAAVDPVRGARPHARIWWWIGVLLQVAALLAFYQLATSVGANGAPPSIAPATLLFCGWLFVQNVIWWALRAAVVAQVRDIVGLLVALGWPLAVAWRGLLGLWNE